MSAPWKTVRVFVSSTFRDMHAERDHLVRVVFPELRERCAQRQLYLVDVDLRWGVTEEDAQRGRALEICLREIEDCRPFFVGILGERYGWIPPRYDIPDEETFDAVRGVEAGHSITAMEIYQGVLDNPQMRARAHFYFRDPSFIASLPRAKRRDFLAEDIEHAEKLRNLKDRIRASGFPVRENYRRDDLDAWGQQVLEDLWEAIRAEHPAPDPETLPEPDPLTIERAYHDFFIETRTEMFIGQGHLLSRLHEYASGNVPGPMLVTGTPGCGKSALLARFVSQFRRWRPKAIILYHFVGASPSSTDLKQMLRRRCEEILREVLSSQMESRLAEVSGQSDEAGWQRAAIEQEYEIPDEYAELRKKFKEFCGRAAEESRVVLLFDALNQLDETDLKWLPVPLPPGLRMILSSVEGDTLAAAKQMYPHRQDMIVTSLRLVDQGFIIARQLQRARKRLTTARKYRQWRAGRLTRTEQIPAEADRSQLRYILTGVYSRQEQPTPEQTVQRETANPLYLKLVAEELRMFGDYDRLGEFIARLPTDVPGMFHMVLDRLDKDCGRDLVQHALSLVATGRHGLLEGELLELLARRGESRFPMALWSRLYRTLAFYMKPRASVAGGEEGLIDFFHRQLAKVVRDRYVATGGLLRTRHAELADYFYAIHHKNDAPTGSGLSRAATEMVYHSAAVDRGKRLAQLVLESPQWHAPISSALLHFASIPRWPAGFHRTLSKQPALKALQFWTSVYAQARDDADVQDVNEEVSRRTVSFAMQGVPAVGRTMWLMMFHGLVRNSASDLANVMLEPLPADSGLSLQQDFDQMLRDVLDPTRAARSVATVQGEKHPLLYRIRQRRRWWAPKRSYLSLIMDHPPSIDGLMFFYDVTQPAEPQIRALQKIAADYRSRAKRATSKSLKLPVAVCLTKIDLLVDRHSGRPGIEWFYHALSTIDWDTDAGSRRRIEARSAAALSCITLLEPSLDRVLKSLFGEVYRYFPISALGLERQSDSREERFPAHFQPYGVMEPLLWLLDLLRYRTLT
ncbi:MAG: DUF4062 domain-containing protein [Pirellulales bacterium]|nr:DUF4062 domain-containing protein [Pirellulales bacterium]